MARARALACCGRCGGATRGSSALPAIAMALALGAATAWFILRTAAGQQ